MKAAIVLIALLITPVANAQRDPPISVHFPQGARTTTVSGTLANNASEDYEVNVEGPEVIQLKLIGSNNTVMQLYAPGDTTALNADGDGQHFSGLLTTPGVYLIRVYHPQGSAPSDTEARYTLSIALR